MARLLFDIETDGLLDQLTSVHSLVIKDIDTEEVFSFRNDGHKDNLLRMGEGVQMLAAADELIGHNIIKFDIPALQKVFPWFWPRGRPVVRVVLCRLLWPEIGISDAKLTQSGKLPKKLAGRYSLEAFGYRVGLWKGDYSDLMKERGLDPWASWNQEMQDYCEQDVAVNRAIWQRCEENWFDLKKPEAQRLPYGDDAIRLEMRVAEIIARQERRGVAFDRTKAEALYVVLNARRSELERQLQETFGSWNASAGIMTVKKTREVKRTDLDVTITRRRFGKTGKELKPYIGPVKELYEEGARYSKVKVVEFNPGSYDHIADRLIKLRGWEPTEFTDGGKPKVDDTILGQLPWPEAQLIAEYLMVNKRISAVAEGKQAWLKKERDGRIYGSVITAGAVTRRMTHNSPNLAQVPKNDSPYGHECRELFTTTAGYLLLGCDADALELRCLAGYMARFDGGAYIETVLKGNKALGTDMHSVNCRALGLDPKATYTIDGKTVGGRDIAKTWFYAFIYGAGDWKLGYTMGVRGSAKKIIAAGKKSRADFLAGLPALGKLAKAVQTRVKTRGILVGLDGGKSQVRSAHSALNTLLQGAGAIIMKKALVILDDDLQAHGLVPGVDYEFVLNVHDEWQIEILAAHVTEEIDDKGAAKLRSFIGDYAEDAIRKAGEQLNFLCPLAGNYDVGRNWAETH